MATPAHTRASSPPEFKAVVRPERFCNVGRLFEMLEQRGLEGIVSYLRTNVFYLSGLAPPASMSIPEVEGYAAVIISRHEPAHPVMVVSDSGLTCLLQQPTWIKDVRPYLTYLLPFDIPLGPSPIDAFMPAELLQTEWGRAAREKCSPNLIEATRGAIKDLGLHNGRVGFDNLGFANAVRQPEMQVVDAYGALKYVREVKTPEEVTFLRRATELNQQAIEQTVRSWSRGMSWQEMIHTYNATAASLGGFVRDPGGLVIANVKGPEPAFYLHAGPEDFAIESGMNIMWDCHGTLDHYCWDGGKTWVVDDEPRGLGRQVAKATGAAMDEIVSALRPGAKISQLQAKARQVFREGGCSNADQIFIFFHGLGLDHIDMETGETRRDWSLEERMVVSAHLVVPGDDHTRNWLEDICLVTKDGGDRFFTWGHEPIAGNGSPPVSSVSAGQAGDVTSR